MEAAQHRVSTAHSARPEQSLAVGKSAGAECHIAECGEIGKWVIFAIDLCYYVGMEGACNKVAGGESGKSMVPQALQMEVRNMNWWVQ